VLHLFRQTASELCTGKVPDLLVDISQRMAVSTEMSLSRRDAESDLFDLDPHLRRHARTAAKS
jgi:hypothetical protein